MLIGVTDATRKIAASATTTAVPPTTSGTPAATARPEDDQQREGGQRQRDELAAPQVRLRHGLDVAVERRAAGQLDRQAGRLVEPLAQDRQGVGRVVRRQVEEDDVVGGVPVGRDLPRRQEVRDDAGDVRRARRCRRRPPPRRPRRPGVPASSGRAAEDDDERRRRRRRARVSRSAFARADSRSSRMKPPARQDAPGPAARAAGRRAGPAAQAPTTHHARRATNRPRRSKGVTARAARSYRRGWPFSAGGPSASIAPPMQLLPGRPSSSRSRSLRVRRLVGDPVMIGIMLRGPRSRPRAAPRWVRRDHEPERASYLFTFLFVAWALVLRDRAAARAPRGRRLAVRRDRPDRPVHRLLHHDGLPLGGHRGMTPRSAAATRGRDRTRRHRPAIDCAGPRRTIALSSADLQMHSFYAVASRLRQSEASRRWTPRRSRPPSRTRTPPARAAEAPFVNLRGPRAGARPGRPPRGQPPRADLGGRPRRAVERLALAAQPPGQRPRRDRADPRPDRRGARGPLRAGQVPGRHHAVLHQPDRPERPRRPDPPPGHPAAAASTRPSPR